MISGDFTHCTSLNQFHEEISSLHRKAHGEEYTAHHSEMFARLSNECVSYRELGVNQGATAACAAIAGIKDLHLIDIDLKPFRPYEHLFEGYALKLYEGSDLEVPGLYPVDFLLIDSLHTYEHVKKQLTVHSPYVDQYILIHDSAAKLGIRRAVDEFVAESNDDWVLTLHYPKNVGYSLIERM